jgi:hypothetical protein
MDAQDSPEDNRQRLCLKLFNNSRTHAATRLYESHGRLVRIYSGNNLTLYKCRTVEQIDLNIYSFFPAMTEIYNQPHLVFNVIYYFISH